MTRSVSVSTTAIEIVARPDAYAISSAMRTAEHSYAVGVELGPTFGRRMEDDEMRDLPWCPGLLIVVTNEDFGSGSYCIFDTIGIKEAAHDPAENMPAIHERQCLAGYSNFFYGEPSIFVRREIIRAALAGPFFAVSSHLIKGASEIWNSRSQE